MGNNILATLAYYDVLDFPLRPEEVLRCLVKINNQLNQTYLNLENVKKTLDQLLLEKLIDREGNYYFLSGRDYLVPLRIKRAKISKRKWAKAKGAIGWLQFFPYLEAVFASGSLALGNCDELSDLDVLVVTKHGRIWLARFLITVWFSWLGVRRKPEQKIAPDKICLNHYITEKSLRIPFESLYNAQNYVNLKPLLMRDQSLITKFQDENNWIKNYIIGPWVLDFDGADRPAVKISFVSGLISNICRLILDASPGNWLEKLTKGYQIKKIVRNPLTRSPSGHVVFNDNQLAFHPDSPEVKILETYQMKLKELGP